MKDRSYLKYARSLAEKTDIGRLTAPSLLKLAYESIRSTDGSSNGKTSAEIWEEIERILEVIILIHAFSNALFEVLSYVLFILALLSLQKASASFTDSSKFGCYLVMDTRSLMSVNAALRYWGCAIQAGTRIHGVLGFSPQSSGVTETIIQKFSPLPFGCLPYVSTEESVDLSALINSLNRDLKVLFQSSYGNFQSAVTFDSSQKSVTLFMPGFNKSEIKLYQVRH